MRSRGYRYPPEMEEKMKYTIANVSCGKDSLAMVEEHIKRGRQLDEVVMYDTGMEFQAIYDTWAKLTARLDEIGIKHTVLCPCLLYTSRCV